MSLNLVKERGPELFTVNDLAPHLRGGAACRHFSRPAGILVPPLTGSGHALIRYRDGRREAAWVDPWELFRLREGAAP